MISTKHQIPNTKESPITDTSSSKHEFDLEARTLEFAKRVIRVCRTVPFDPVNRDLLDQVVRASGSVGANYREANDALSRKDFSHRIRITRREAKEAYFWLQLLEEANPNHSLAIQEVQREAVELKKIFSAIAKKA